MTDNFSHIDGKRDLICLENLDSVMSRTKAVVFDLDGTLTDSISQILACTHHTFDYYGFEQPCDKAIMSTIGKELSDALRMLLPEDKKSIAEEFTKTYREIFKEHKEYWIDILFDGVEPLLKRLRELDLKIGYASGRSLAGVKRTLDGTFLGDYCDGICAGSEVPSKPDPAMMYSVCKRMNTLPESALGVGDSGLDIKMYKNSSSLSLAVQTGVWSGKALLELKPDLLISKIGDLTSYLN
ncbi:MAG: HAD family hydrolase [Succinivibrio sp.]